MKRIIGKCTICGKEELAFEVTVHDAFDEVPPWKEAPCEDCTSIALGSCAICHRVVTTCDLKYAGEKGFVCKKCFEEGK